MTRTTIVQTLTAARPVDTAQPTRMSSPAVLRLPQAPGSSDLLFGGDVISADGTPLVGATLTLWGVELDVDTDGSFELLVTADVDGPAVIDVRITAPGHAPSDASLRIDDSDVTYLSDGTLVVLHTFVLDAVSAHTANRGRS